MKELWNGYKFGMLLQVAVGPVFLLVFNTAAEQGFAAGCVLALAAASVDAFYIALSALGAAALLKRAGVQRVLRLFGCAVLLLFGLNMLLGAFGFSLLPALSFFEGVEARGLFLRGVLFTASNPLTILFWSGVFAAQTAQRHLDARGLTYFGAGCVMATLISLTVVALLAGSLGGLLPQSAMNVLNGVVGVALMLFGIKLILPEKSAKASEENI